MKKFLKRSWIYLVMGILLLASIIVNIVLVCQSNTVVDDGFSGEQLGIMGRGVLLENYEFDEGEDVVFTYDFSHKEIKEKYELDKYVGASEFETAMNLVHEFAPRMNHGNYDGSVGYNGMDLIEYALDNDKHPIFCRAKAQILNEMLLSLNIYSRKLWFMPVSVYDNECHVVNEIWDTKLNKWIMVDISNDFYFADESYTPLSILEIRDLLAHDKKCAPIKKGQEIYTIDELIPNKTAFINYYMKNLPRLEYMTINSVGETEFAVLEPKAMFSTANNKMTVKSITKSPLE